MLLLSVTYYSNTIMNNEVCINLHENPQKFLLRNMFHLRDHVSTWKRMPRLPYFLSCSSPQVSRFSRSFKIVISESRHEQKPPARGSSILDV